MRRKTHFKSDPLATLQAITRRRVELAGEIDELGGLGGLSCSSLKDFISLVAFDDCCAGGMSYPQRSRIGAWPAPEMWHFALRLLEDRNHADPSSARQEIANAIERGAGLALGLVSVERAWRGKSDP